MLSRASSQGLGIFAVEKQSQVLEFIFRLSNVPTGVFQHFGFGTPRAMRSLHEKVHGMIFDEFESEVCSAVVPWKINVRVSIEEAVTDIEATIKADKPFDHVMVYRCPMYFPPILEPASSEPQVLMNLDTPKNLGFGYGIQADQVCLQPHSWQVPLQSGTFVEISGAAITDFNMSIFENPSRVPFESFLLSFRWKFPS